MNRIQYALILLVLPFLFACSKKDNQETLEEKIDTTLVLVTQVRQCARLHTAECEIHKVITHDDELHLQGSFLQKDINIKLPLGKRKVAIPLSATVKAYVDFSTFSESNVRRYGESIDVLLPDPQVVITQTKISNSDIRKQVPFLRSDFTTEELSQYEQEGRDEIAKSLPSLGILKQAEEGAAKVLIPLLEQLGYKPENITISFHKDVGKTFNNATYNITDK